MTTKFKFPKAVWTPWAEILCYGCHGPIFKNRDYDMETKQWKDKELKSSEYIALTTPSKIEEGKAITKCSKCESLVQINESIAMENNVVFALRAEGIDACMEQTGGMNSAGYVPKINPKENGFYYITHDWDGDGMYMAGSYDFEGECVEDFEENHIVTKDFTTLIEFFKMRKDTLEKIEAK